METVLRFKVYELRTLYQVKVLILYTRVCIYTKADRKVRFPYLLKINSDIYFQNQIHNMKA